MSAVGTIRAFRHADIPAVAALRQPSFRHSERGSVAALAAYLEELFFSSRFTADDLRSLVYEEDGEVTGFLGIVPRTMLLRGSPVRVAVATQLMSAPSNRGLAGRRLMRALFDGPQDLTIADLGNDAARRIHEALGGRTAVAYSLSWLYPLRPVRHFVMRWARGGPGRLVAYLLRPLCAVADAALLGARGPDRERVDGDCVVPMDMPLRLPELEELIARWALRPKYDRLSLESLLLALREKDGCQDLRQCLVRDRRDRVVGWFLYCPNPGGLSQVVQMAARKGAGPRVIAQLFDHARANGVVALTGRLDPTLLPALTRAGCLIVHEGNWMLIHSRHADVLEAVERNDAFLSRLEGEWWLSF